MNLKQIFLNGVRLLFTTLWHPLMAIRRFCYQNELLRSVKLPGYVVAIGNLTTGGTGKTPVAIALSRWLLDKGQNPVILTRGYKSGLGKDEAVCLLKDQEIWLTPKKDRAFYADEAREEAHALGIPVIIGQNRSLAARLFLEKNPPPSHWVLDDGFQHLKIKRDLDLLLFDSSWPLGHPLDFATQILREHLGVIAKADAILFTRFQKGQKVLVAREMIEEKCKISFDVPFATKGPYSLKDKTPAPHEMPYTLVTAIAQPNRVLTILKAQGFEIQKEIIKTDHQRFFKEDLASIETPVITTEKDFYRDPQLFLNHVKDFYVLHIEALLGDDLKDYLTRRLIN